MARYIDADIMREDWLTNGENEYVYDTNAVLDSIDSQPTADVVEVVRCKDCKYKDSCLQKVDCDYQYREIDFCSYGERKDADGKDKIKG